MSKEDTPPGGLLSKVVRFVRNPTVNWTDLDGIEAERESQYSKQVLKEMIERKRRNDFVRRREFDYLRKLRKQDPLTGQRAESPGARPSFFHSSLTSPVERAVTIQKIDEIEAQMSMQWWKGKPQGAALPHALAPDPEGRPAQAGGLFDVSTTFAPTALLSLPMAMEPQTAASPLFADDSMSVTGFGGVASLVLQPPQRSALENVQPGSAYTSAAEMEEFVHEPDLEEAAIRFANGDHAGAEAGLLEVLAQHAADDAEQQFDIWMTLFDLYRATGQQDRFDTLALDFAALFSRSAPLWFSIPEQLGLAVEPTQGAPALARREFSWNAPATLTLQTVTALQASLARAASPWTLAWGRIVNIEAPALTALADEFDRWADQRVQIVFAGADVLHALMQSHTQSGDRNSNPEWWRMRMAALRFMGLPDDFEIVALDYCVTYEVSPPSWASPQCVYSDVSVEAAAPKAAPAAHAPADLLAKTHWGDLNQPAGLGSDEALHGTSAAPSFSGHIEGDASAVLNALAERARPGAPLLVACDRLIRIDFSAAGSVLNWAAEQQALGHVVHFHNLHRLVAVFFNVIGISEHAWVIPRKN